MGEDGAAGGREVERRAAGVARGRGGMGRRGGGYPRGEGDRTRDRSQPAALKVRWESAMPVRAAELKVHDENAPAVDESHYAIAVYGIPGRMIPDDTNKLAGELKKEATLKRDGKKDLRPSSVKVLRKEDGPVIVYLFPRSKEITAKDERLDFGAKIGRWKLESPFFVEDMTYQGKLEL